MLVLRLAIQLDRKFPSLLGVVRLIVNHRSFPPSQAHQKQRPFPPPALPGLHGPMALSDSQTGRRPFWRRSETRPSTSPEPPPLTQIAFLACRAHYPSGPDRCLSVDGFSAIPRRASSLSVQPSPFLRRVGAHIFTFEACSSFTRVTACLVAHPPFVGFIARLRPNRFPGSNARKLSSPTNDYLSGSIPHW